MISLAVSRWRKSSFSGQESDCVEVASDLGHVRDSKAPGAGVLRVSVASLVRLVRVSPSD